MRAAIPPGGHRPSQSTGRSPAALFGQCAGSGNLLPAGLVFAQWPAGALQRQSRLAQTASSRGSGAAQGGPQEKPSLAQFGPETALGGPGAGAGRTAMVSMPNAARNRQINSCHQVCAGGSGSRAASASAQRPGGSAASAVERFDHCPASLRGRSPGGNPIALFDWQRSWLAGRPGFWPGRFCFVLSGPMDWLADGGAPGASGRSD